MPSALKEGSVLKVFASYYRPHWKLFLLDMVCALCISLVDLAFPYMSKLSMEHLLPQGLFQTFFTVMVILLLAYVGRSGLIWLVGYYGHLLGARIETDIRRDLFTHIQSLSFSFFDKNRTGKLMSRVTGDLFEITELAHHGPEDLFISLITLIGAFVIMLSIRWELALVVFIVIPLFLIFTVIQRRKMAAASLAMKQDLAGINGDLESALSGMRTAKAFGNEEIEHRKFCRSNNRYRDAKRHFYKTMSTYQSGLELAMCAMSVLVIAGGGFLIMEGKMDYVELITFSLYISTFLVPLRKLSAFVEQYLTGMAGLRRFLELMRTEPEVQDAPNAKELSDVQGEIRLEDLSFRYQQEAPVLEHIDLTIHPRETVAIVGPSGGGKSTLCQLIPRFYDATEGRILIDGQDVRNLTQRSLHKSIGIVQQDVFLFPDSIRENIRYGRPDATDEEVEEAARKAELLEDIRAMPQGFDSYVGERGAMLSGGQKQRVAIARIFLKNPPILILDEATSALDSVTESRIQSAFDELARGRTTLIIAHRLATVRSAHRILLIDGCGIAEEGTRQELLAKNGRFAALWHSQDLEVPHG